MFMRMIYDEKLAQAAYLIGCQQTAEAIVIDPERDVDRYTELAEANGLRVVAVAETHIHADFVSGARELAERLDAKVYVSDEGDADWKYQWLNSRISGGGYSYRLLKDGDSFGIGKIEFKVMHTPGHTPEHLSFFVTDRGGGATEPIGMASGDFVFVGDLGRPDLLEKAAGKIGAMEPSARRLFDSVGRLGEVPEFVQVWPAHGAGSACGKSLGAVPTSTIGYEKRFNPAIQAAKDESKFVDYILAGQPEPPLYFATMKRVNKDGPKILGKLPEPSRLAASELHEINIRSNALIDTRPWDEFSRGHVLGSLSFPLSRSFTTDVGSMVGEHEDIYLVVVEERLEEAVRDLVRIGLDQIKGWFDAEEMTSLDLGLNLSTLDNTNVHEAADMIANKKVNVLDVRRASEFEEGHLPGAQNIAHTRLASRLEELSKAKPLLVNCRSGTRSARSCAFLKREGFEVINLKGGMLAWEQATALSTER